MEGLASPAAKAGVLERSHAWCEAGVRKASTSFYLGMRLAPAEKRRGLYALYRWMREADNIVDCTIDHDDPSKRWREETRDAIEAFWQCTLEVGSRDDELWPAFGWACERFGIERAWLRGVMDGMVADAFHQPLRTMEELDTYCHQVAGTVGMCCTAIFGVRDGASRAEALVHAERLGRGFQLVNILRDMPGDMRVHGNPRCYIPESLFAKHGLGSVVIAEEGLEMHHPMLAWKPAKACEGVVRELVAKADELFASWRVLDSMLEPDSRATLWAMQARYRWLLERIRRDPSVCSRTPVVRPGGLPKAWIAAGALARRVLTPVLLRRASAQ